MASARLTRRLALAGILAAIAVVMLRAGASPERAKAAFPGTNGLLAYSENDDPSWQPLLIEAPDLLWGDLLCDGAINEVDALDLLNAVADSSNPQGANGCPAMGDSVDFQEGAYAWGDWDCSGTPDAADVMPLLTHLAGVDTIAPCPEIYSPASGLPLIGGVLAEFDVVGETLRVWTDNPDTIQQLLDLEAGTGNPTFPIGPLLIGPGPGGYNEPWSYHFDPDEVAMTEAAIEVCDATPSYVQQNPDQFFQVGYCPWSAALVSLADYR